MAREIRRTPRARQDLIEVWLYIATDNEAAADRLLDRVGKILDMLRDTPKAGRERRELGQDVRSFAVNNYLLFYRETPAGVELIRFLSARLDFDADDFAT